MKRLAALVVVALVSLLACNEDPTSPAQGRRSILFTVGLVDDGEIWDMNEDGTAWRRLTNNTVMDLAPRWSANHQRIVFTRARSGFEVPSSSMRFDVYIMNADGSNAARVGESPSIDSLPTFSPDGSRIAFLGRDITAEASYSRVFVMGVDGTNRQTLSALGLRAMTPAEWSPDGQTLLFGARREGETTPMELFIMNADGTNSHTIPEPCAFSFRLGRWSRDGSRISITCLGGGDDPLYTMTPTGADFRRITPPKPAESSISDLGGMWSVTGDFLLVMRSEIGSSLPIYKLHTTTGAATRVAQVSLPTFLLADWWTVFPPD
jgi:TolB protein